METKSTTATTSFRSLVFTLPAVLDAITEGSKLSILEYILERFETLTPQAVAYMRNDIAICIETLAKSGQVELPNTSVEYPDLLGSDFNIKDRVFDFDLIIDRLIDTCSGTFLDLPEGIVLESSKQVTKFYKVIPPSIQLH